MMSFKETGRSPGANDNLSPCNYNQTDNNQFLPLERTNSMAEKASKSAAREADHLDPNSLLCSFLCLLLPSAIHPLQNSKLAF